MPASWLSLRNSRDGFSDFAACLRGSVTGLYVADARSGAPLFAVNGDDPLNPASNVKMISTATALSLLGADFRYPTRVIGAPPDAGVVHGDVYLLGSYDPTLNLGDLDELAAAVAARGVTRIDGRLVVGADPTRDGIFRAIVPIEIRGGEPGQPAIATPPAGIDLIAPEVTARTTGGRPRLTIKATPGVDAAGHPRVVVAIAGTIGHGATYTYPLAVHDRTALAAYALGAALRRHGVAIGGDFRVLELPAFLGAAGAAGILPIELARHDSPRLADIIARVNKWSINWLADRVIITAAALASRSAPSMDGALSAMYDWLEHRPGIAKAELVVDTGSGLSYKTQITARELESVVRAAAGFAGKPEDVDPAAARAWVDSLAVAGTDGTLGRRFRGSCARGKLHAKTGTLSTAIALSGVLDVDPERPLAFSIITNTDAPLAPRYVRGAHEQLVGLLCGYLDRTRRAGTPALVAAAPPPTAAAATDLADLEELGPDPALDDETAAAP